MTVPSAVTDLIIKTREHENMKFTEDDIEPIEGLEGRLNLPWAYEHYGKWLNDFQKESQQIAMSPHYKADTDEGKVFHAFAAYLGKGNKISEDQKKIMLNEFQKDFAVIKEDITVFRKASDRTEDLITGNVITWNGFLSTGLIESRLKDNLGKVEYEIFVPKWSRGIYLDFISIRPDEMEMLFPYGQKMKILKVVTGDITKVTAELVLPDRH